MDFDTATVATGLDLNASGKLLLKRISNGMKMGWCFTGGCGTGAPSIWHARTGAKARNELFGLTNIKSLFDHPASHSNLVVFIHKAEDGLGMTRGKTVLRQISMDFIRQIEQAKGIGNSGAIPANFLSDLFLSQRKVIHKASISTSFLDWIEVFALKIFDQRKFVGFDIGDHLDDGGDGGEARLLTGAITAFPGNNLKLVLARPHRDGLEDAMFTNGCHQFVEGFFGEAEPRLPGVCNDLRKRDGSYRCFGGCRDIQLQALAGGWRAGALRDDFA